MQSEDIDKLFRDQLRDHAPTPPAYLWNQLEAELQPAKKRPAMWLYAAAAVVALLLVAGGAWLVPNSGLGTSEGQLAARQPAPATSATPAAPAVPAPAAAPENADSKKMLAAQATPAASAPSTPSAANRAADHAAPLRPTASATAPRPAAHRVELLAEAGTARSSAAGTRRGPVVPTLALPQPVVAPPARPEPDPAIDPVVVAQVAPPVVPAGAIEVEVRRGAEPAAGALAAAPEEHGLVDRLLRKAGKAALHEVRQKVDVPVLTLNVLNHSVSTKNIQL